MIRSAARAARSGSSSWAAGTPKYAQIPSAHERLDHAAEVLDPPAHPGDALAHERLHLVGPEPLAQAGRPDDVGEQGRDRPHLVLRSRFHAHQHLLAPQPSPPTRG